MVGPTRPRTVRTTRFFHSGYSSPGRPKRYRGPYHPGVPGSTRCLRPPLTRPRWAGRRGRPRWCCPSHRSPGCHPPAEHPIALLPIITDLATADDAVHVELDGIGVQDRAARAVDERQRAGGTTPAVADIEAGIE